MSTRVIPTFLLKGLDPNEVLVKYQSGLYSRPIPQKSKINISKNIAVLATSYGTSNKDPIFCAKDRNNCSLIVATTGHHNYEVFTTTGGNLPTGGRCEHCRDTFEEIAVGYPIGYQEQTILVSQDNNFEKSNYKLIYVFWVEGTFCTFECALGYVNLLLTRPAAYRDTIIRDSERLLKMLYDFTYPNNKTLRPAPDPRLLKVNGGSLTKDEWSDYRHVYNRTDRVLMIPAKVEYLRQNFIYPANNINTLQNNDVTTP